MVLEVKVMGEFTRLLFHATFAYKPSDTQIYVLPFNFYFICLILSNIMYVYHMYIMQAIFFHVRHQYDLLTFHPAPTTLAAINIIKDAV